MNRSQTDGAPSIRDNPNPKLTARYRATSRGGNSSQSPFWFWNQKRPLLVSKLYGKSENPFFSDVSGGGSDFFVFFIFALGWFMFSKEFFAVIKEDGLRLAFLRLASAAGEAKELFGLLGAFVGAQWYRPGQ